MSKTKMTRKQKTLLLAENAILTAIIVIMAFTPLGYLQVGIVKMTFIMIPVAIGAIIGGPTTGAFLGLVFGITSFVQCFGMDAFGTTLMQLNPLGTFIMCVGTRTLMGYLCGWIFKGVAKINRPVAYFTASLSGAILNTLFFMTLLIVFFGKSDFIMGIRGDLKLLPFLVAFVGLNGLLEIIACAVIGSPVSAAIDLAYKKLK